MHSIDNFFVFFTHILLIYVVYGYIIILIIILSQKHINGHILVDNAGNLVNYISSVAAVFILCKIAR